MNTASDSSNKPPECNKKRRASPRQQDDSPLSKQPRVDEQEDGETGARERAENDAVRLKHKNGAAERERAPEPCEDTVQSANGTRVSSGTGRKDRDGDAESCEGQKARSDCATRDAAEALASLTEPHRGAETPCSSRQALGENTASKPSRAEPEPSGRVGDGGSGAGGEARVRARRAVEDEEEEDDDDDDDDDSLPGSSVTASSSDDDDDDQEREECAIVSVQMAPELRRSVALLVQVQMLLDALEKKGARLHRRLELRLGRQRRPHIEQRAAIAQSIPGFWLTAVSFLQNAPLHCGPMFCSFQSCRVVVSRVALTHRL